MARLILASTSLHRRALLERLGVGFTTHAPGIDEARHERESPQALAMRLADEKAATAAAPDAIVIGSDQVASRAGRILRKPGSHAKALEQLLACQGRQVDFYTAVTVIDRARGDTRRHVDHTAVHFATLPTGDLDRYLKREQPYNCAGGFKAEGLGIVLFERIESRDPTALIGLPLIWLAATLRAMGLNPLAER